MTIQVFFTKILIFHELIIFFFFLKYGLILFFKKYLVKYIVDTWRCIVLFVSFVLLLFYSYSKIIEK